MIDLCQYRNIAGAPGTGIHAYRLFNVSMVDVIGTALMAVLFSYFFNISIFISLAIFFGAGIVAHRLFCVRTTFDKILFPDG